MARSPETARRLALILACSSLLGALGWLWSSAVYNRETNFLPRWAPAEWIVYPSVPQAAERSDLLMNTVFRRSLDLQTVSRTTIRIAGFHAYTLSVNGTAFSVPAQAGANWKRPDVFEVSTALRPGENRIEVTVFNTNGPPALWLALHADTFDLATDETWEASHAGSVWRAARLATKPEAIPAGNPLFTDEQPAKSFTENWLWLACLAALSAVGVCLIRARPPAGETGTAGKLGSTALFLAGVAALWLALFANNVRFLPPLTGYDTQGHIDYILYIQKHHALPLANEGWEMHQAPLYYLISVIWLKLLALSLPLSSAVAALRWLGLAISIAHLIVIRKSLRLLFPGEPSKQILGLIFAGFLPPLIYLSQYLTNEPLAAMLISTCVYLTLRILKADGVVSWKAYAVLGLAMGLALLAKTSSVLVVPAVFGALLWRRLETRGTPAPRQTFHLLLSAAVCLVVCGWHYSRVWLRLGNPLIGPWGFFHWWQDDGYRTSAFYLQFGTALMHPWFGALDSFCGGIFSSLWGDGLWGGATGFLARPPWNHELMAMGYWLSMLPSLAVLAGGLIAVVKFLRRPSAEWFLLLGLSFAVIFALLHLSLKVPHYGIVKAFYGLSALVPFCAMGASGLDSIGRRVGKLRFVLSAALVVWALNTYASFWIWPSSRSATLALSRELLRQRRPQEAARILETRLQREAQDAGARQLLVTSLTLAGAEKQAFQQAKIAALSNPGDANCHLLLGRAFERLRRNEEAIAEARTAIRVGPGCGPAYELLAGLLLKSKNPTEALQVSRAGLRILPFSPELRWSLGSALPADAQAEAEFQFQLAFNLEPNPAVADYKLARVLEKKQLIAEAISHYTAALRSTPDFPDALNRLARIRAASPSEPFRDATEALLLAERACRVTEYKEPAIVATLAMAYAEAKHFEEATATAEKARRLALARNQTRLAEKYQHLVELFTTRQPYRETIEGAD